MTFYFVVVALAFLMSPEAMNESMGIVGADINTNSVVTFTAFTFFDFVVPVYATVFYVIFAILLVHRTVATNSLASYLSMGIPRKNYITTAGTFLILVVSSVFFLQFAIGAILFRSVYGAFNVWNFFNVTLMSFLCTMTVAMVSFFFSTAFAGKTLGMGLVVGAPVLFVLLMMLSSLTPPLEFLKYLTPFGWFDSVRVVTGSFKLWYLVDLGYLAITASLFVASIFIFNRKQLSI